MPLSRLVRDTDELTTTARKVPHGQTQVQGRRQHRHQGLVPGLGAVHPADRARGSPNILYIVLDDVGFSAMEPFGGLIETPNIKRIAEQG